jgi:hypothetical protein
VGHREGQQAKGRRLDHERQLIAQSRESVRILRDPGLGHYALKPSASAAVDKSAGTWVPKASGSSRSGSTKPPSAACARVSRESSG